MTRLQGRFKAVVARYGEDVGGAPAVVAPLSPSRARAYAADSEIDAVGRPLWLAYAAFDHPATEGATVTWRTRTLAVKRAIDVRFGGATVARLLALFPTSGVGTPEP